MNGVESTEGAVAEETKKGRKALKKALCVQIPPTAEGTVTLIEEANESTLSQQNEKRDGSECDVPEPSDEGKEGFNKTEGEGHVKMESMANDHSTSVEAKGQDDSLQRAEEERVREKEAVHQARAREKSAAKEARRKRRGSSRGQSKVRSNASSDGSTSARALAPLPSRPAVVAAAQENHEMVSPMRRRRRNSVAALSKEMTQNHSLGAVPSPQQLRLLPGLMDDRKPNLQHLSPVRVQPAPAVQDGFLAPAKLRNELSECVSNFVAPLDSKPMQPQAGLAAFKPKCKLDLKAAGGWDVAVNRPFPQAVESRSSRSRKKEKATEVGTQMRAVDVVSAARGELSQRFVGRIA